MSAKSIIGRRVTHAKLHEGLFIPGGTGDLGKNFPSNEKSIDDLDMRVHEMGLYISGCRRYPGTATGVKFEVLVPWPNVIQSTLGAADEVPTVSLNAQNSKTTK
jgi:hypothetical protein